uniref:Fatty acid desaturase domain-containing protein n=1 Tax=viral metagenome TaxID=1070528 RepID=A0A6C0JH73_9ZZZZ
MEKSIIIGDFKYDITNFKHPGGGVIHYFNDGQDATMTFDEFHYRSKKAKQILKTLPCERVILNKNDADKEMLEDFVEFRKSLEMRGYFRPSYLHVYYRLFEIFAIYLVAAVSIKYNIVASVFLFGLCSGRTGWLQHEGGHNSLTTNIKIDKEIQSFFIGFFMFGDGSMWNNMHNKHHATPQKIGHDIDLDTAPLVAFYDSSSENNQMSQMKKLWLKYQAYTFLPLTSGLLVMPFWSFYLHPKKVFRDKNIKQALYILAGHVVRICLFLKIMPMSLFNACLYHFMAIWISGIYLFGHFSLSHTFTPTIDKNENPNWVRYAIEHTVDISPNNRFVGWFMGYLNNQVIHHLFPSMPQVYGREVSRELLLFCKKWDIKYNIISYFQAWDYMLKNLNSVGELMST